MGYEEMIPQLEYFICRYCNSQWVMPETTIDFIDLTYVIDGSATYYVNSIPYNVEKGDLLCIPRGSTRAARIDPSDPMACYAANLKLIDFKGHPVSLPFLVVSKIGIRDDLMSLYSELNMEWIRKKSGYPIKVRSLLLDLLYHYLHIGYYQDVPRNSDPRLQRVLSYIYDNYQRNISVDDLASLIGLNTSYFGTYFKEATGYPVKEYINRVKINHAENLISGGNITLSEVAHQSGFEDPFYFSKVYKKVKGYPPSRTVITTFVNERIL